MMKRNLQCIAFFLLAGFLQAVCFAQTATVTTFSGTGFGNVDGPSRIGVPVSNFNTPYGVDVDGSGNVYVADKFNHKIRKITPEGIVSTLAGNGSRGSTDGTGTTARFNYPSDVAVDGSGNVYVADQSNHKIRKITAAGIVSTLAGTGSSGNTDGSGTLASFSAPSGLVLDASGNLYVADYGNHKIRKITPDGMVSTFAGTGAIGSTNGAAASATFNNPSGVDFDGSGNLFVADRSNSKIRKITSGGVVSTFAGSGSQSSYDETGIYAGFFYPSDVTVDAAGNVYVADSFNNRIRKISSAGVVTTLAGKNSYGGGDDGKGVVVKFSKPHGVAVDGSGNVYVADRDNHKIRKITSDGTVSTLAGTGVVGSIDGMATAASYDHPHGVAVDGLGNVYLADSGNNNIRKITAEGLVTTVAGGSTGIADGPGMEARFNRPTGLVVDLSGNLYVADRSNHKIRKITAAGVVTTLAGDGVARSLDGTGTAASFNDPSGIAVDAAGNVYVADRSNNKIRKITAAGVVSTFAGSGTPGSTDGTGTVASFDYPTGITLDGLGNLYISDMGNHKIRKITSAGVVSTLAGSGNSGSADGIGTAASFNGPVGIAVDVFGNVYVADEGNHKIRKITPFGVVSTLAGSGTVGSTDGIGTAASFTYPNGLAVDASGNLYVADYGNSKIRKITLSLLTGTSDQAEELGLRVYPNPSNGLLNLDLEGEKHLVLLDMMGQVHLDEVSSAKTFQVNSFSKGIYILKVEQEGKLYKGKLVLE